MKPKEFDELIKQKFDRNDFAYNPENWGRLAEKLDGGGAKKRSLIVWWWIPLAGMAASVALAFGVSSLLRLSTPGNDGVNMAKVQKSDFTRLHSISQGPVSVGHQSAQDQTAGVDAYSLASNNVHRHAINTSKQVAVQGSETNTTDWTEVTLRNSLKNIVVMNSKPFNLLSKDAETPFKKDKHIEIVEAINTFKPTAAAETQKTPKLSVILSGGVNHGNENSGYMAGATIRKMVNDKVYIESDVAIASSNNTQVTEYAVPQSVVTHMDTRVSQPVAKTTAASAENNKTVEPIPANDIIEDKNESYNLYYAQVSPSLGVKVIKKMSVGLGPDFQRMLVDNRPAPSTVYTGNIQVAPLFDVGIIGKTEYVITKKVRAGVYYRKGVNNIITPTDKFIDRDYLQFQVKYAIFNK